MVFLCCVDSSSASLSYAADFDSRSASVSLFEASREEMRDFKELTSDSLEVEEDFKEAISDSRLDRIFSIAYKQLHHSAASITQTRFM